MVTTFGRCEQCRKAVWQFTPAPRPQAQGHRRTYGLFLEVEFRAIIDGEHRDADDKRVIPEINKGLFCDGRCLFQYLQANDRVPPELPKDPARDELQLDAPRSSPGARGPAEMDGSP
jgi:hypothetical protein